MCRRPRGSASEPSGSMLMDPMQHSCALQVSNTLNLKSRIPALSASQVTRSA